MQTQTRGALQHTQTLAPDRSAIGTELYLIFPHMTNHGRYFWPPTLQKWTIKDILYTPYLLFSWPSVDLSTDHQPTSSCPCSYWMTPSTLAACLDDCYIYYTHIQIWKTDTFDPHIVPIFISCSLCHKGTFCQNLWMKFEKRGHNDMVREIFFL